MSVSLFALGGLSSQCPDYGRGWLPVLQELSGGGRASGFAGSRIDFHLTPIWLLAKTSVGLDALKPVSVPTPRG